MTETSTLAINSSFTATSTFTSEIADAPPFSTFRFKYIGQPPTLLNRFTAPDPGSTYRYSPSPEASSNMEVAEASNVSATPASRKSLYEALAGEGQDQETSVPATSMTTRAENKEVSRYPTISNLSHSSTPNNSGSSRSTPSKENSFSDGAVSSLLMPISSNTVQTSSPRQFTMQSFAPVITSATIGDQDVQQDLNDIEPFQPSSPSPLALIDHLEDIARERTELDKIRDLRAQFAEERDELCRRDLETVRAVQRSTEQAKRVMNIAEDALNKTEALIFKHEKRLEDAKRKAQADIVAKRAAEKQDQIRRQNQEMENRRLEEEGRRKRMEDSERRLSRLKDEARILQEAEIRLLREQEEAREQERRKRQELEERRKEQLQKEEQHKEEERQRKEVEERQRKEVEERQRKEEEEERRRKDEERLKIDQDARIRQQELLRKQEEMRKKSEELRQKEVEAEEEARRRAEYEKRKAAVFMMKWGSNDNNPESSSQRIDYQTSNGPSHTNGGRDDSAPLPSPPASTSSAFSQKQASPEHPSIDIIQKNQPILHPRLLNQDNKPSLVTAKQQLQASFVPATTEAGKLVSTEISFATSKPEDDTTKPQGPKKTARGPKAKKAKRTFQNLSLDQIKKEPESPILHPKNERPEHAHAPPPGHTDGPLLPITGSLPTNLPPRAPPSGPARSSIPAVRNIAPVVHALAPTVRPVPEAPVRSHLDITREARSSHWRARPTPPARSPSLSRTPRSQRGRSSSHSVSPPHTPWRGRSPLGRGRTTYDHYSPFREHYPVRREPSPIVSVPRKRTRDGDHWVPDDLRSGVASKRRAVREPSPPFARDPLRSPPSPRTRRVSVQERPAATMSSYQPSSSAVVGAYNARRRMASFQTSDTIHDVTQKKVLAAPPVGLPPRPKSIPSASETLLNRMSDNQSPLVKPAPRKHIPLEFRLTSVLSGGTSLGKRLS